MSLLSVPDNRTQCSAPGGGNSVEEITRPEFPTRVEKLVFLTRLNHAGPGKTINHKAPRAKQISYNLPQHVGEYGAP
jgi:hypothetical protein